MLLRESLGISADGSEKAFHSSSIESFIGRAAPPIPYSVRNPLMNTQHVFTAVDPSGGGASAFSVATIAQDPNGFINVRRRAPQRLAREEVEQHRRQHDVRVGRLRHARDEGRRGYGQHARREVGDELRLALGVAPLRRGLAVQRKQQTRAPRRDAAKVGRQRGDALPLVARLRGRILRDEL